MEYKNPKTNSDTLLVKYKSKVIFDSISIYWESFIIEENEEPGIAKKPQRVAKWVMK